MLIAACGSSTTSGGGPYGSGGSNSPATSPTSLSGKLSTQTDANATQVEYNGHLLYTYSGDIAPGQSNGEGPLGKWFVDTPTWL